MHEEWTRRIVLDPSTAIHRVLAAEDPRCPPRVAALVSGKHALPYLARAVSGTFDVDRCDYLLRDAHATGVRYGVFDLDWLLRSLRFAPASSPNEAPSLAIDGAKGLPAIEAFILARLFMFQQVYLHKATRSAEWMIRSHPLARGAARRPRRAPRRGRRARSSSPHTARRSRSPTTSSSTTASLGCAMHAWEDCKDEAPRATSRERIRVRRALQDVRALRRASDAARARARARDRAREIARDAGLDPDVYVGLDVATDIPFESEEEPLSSSSRRARRARSPRSRSSCHACAARCSSRVRLVFAPELRDAITAAMSDAPR